MKLKYTYMLFVDGEKIQTIKFYNELTRRGKDIAKKEYAEYHSISSKGIEFHRTPQYDREPVHKFNDLPSLEKCVS